MLTYIVFALLITATVISVKVDDPDSAAFFGILMPFVAAFLCLLILPFIFMHYETDYRTDLRRLPSGQWLEVKAPPSNGLAGIMAENEDEDSMSSDPGVKYMTTKGVPKFNNNWSGDYEGDELNVYVTNQHPYLERRCGWTDDWVLPFGLKWGPGYYEGCDTNLYVPAETMNQELE